MVVWKEEEMSQPGKVRESLTEEMMLDWITNMRKKRDERHSRQEELLFQSLKYKAERG